MAKKKINFEEIEINQNKTVSDVMPKKTDIVLAENSEGIYEVITKKDAKKRNIADYEGFIINQTNIEKASAKVKYLENDLFF